jgi:hypothetical protein
MRILVHRGGQQLGPFSLEELRAAVGSGQISQQDSAWWEGAPNWVPVAQVPGLNIATLPIPGAAGGAGGGPAPASGLSIASLILGILSLVGFMCLTGIPAVVCGHVALSRQKSAGVKGSGLAIPGVITGYLGSIVALFILLAAIAFPVFQTAKERANSVKSLSNAKAIMAMCQMYKTEHGGEYPPSLDALKEYPAGPSVFQDPLAPEFGEDGYWYAKPDKDAPPDEVVVASRGKDRRGRRALGHKDGSASNAPFVLPRDR